MTKNKRKDKLDIKNLTILKLRNFLNRRMKAQNCRHCKIEFYLKEKDKENDFKDLKIISVGQFGFVPDITIELEKESYED